MAVVFFGISWKKMAAFSGGPEPSLTGTPGEGTCSGCHSGGQPGGTLQITGLPANYAPDQEYALAVTIGQQGRQRFELSCPLWDGGVEGDQAKMIKSDFSAIATTPTRLDCALNLLAHPVKLNLVFLYSMTDVLDEVLRSVAHHVFRVLGVRF